MEELIGAFLLILVTVIISDGFGGFGARVLTRPGVNPPVWIEPLLERWEQSWQVDNDY